MFVDASAIIAIIAGEDDAPNLASRLDRADQITISPVSYYEATTGLARRRACSLEEAEALVDDFIRESRAEMLTIDAEIARRAIDAFRRYGRGRHPADLNMGDCFAYACATSCGAPLLFKGNDFVHMDVDVV